MTRLTHNSVPTHALLSVRRAAGVRGPAQSGFTLIELMAVVLIIGLAMGIVIPNLTATRHSRLDEQARAVVARLELARERAIATGQPHRLLIDLEAGRYRVEWFTNDEGARAEDEGPAPPDATSLNADTSAPISLSPPREAEREYRPIPSRFGEDEFLDSDNYFVGAQTPDGWIESGELQIVFDADGVSDFAELSIADAWDEQITLEVRPLLDTVRIHDGNQR